MPNKETAKLWFETGDYPTQTQFAQTFDWLLWKDEQLAISDITNLQNILNGLATPVQVFVKADGAGVAFTYTIPANYLLEKIIVQPSAAVAATTLTDTDASENIMEDEAVASGKSVVWAVDMHAIADRHISISNLPVNTVITLIKRKVTL